MWARIVNSAVAEITDIDPAGRFHPSIRWEVVPSGTESGMVRSGNGFDWPEPEPEPIPQRVTRRQAKQQLAVDGLLSQVQPAIDAIEDDTERLLVQIYWDDAADFERQNPELIMLGGALGLDDEAVDEMFRQASKR